MPAARTPTLLLVAGALAFAGCGGDEREPTAAGPAAAPVTTTGEVPREPSASEPAEKPEQERAAASAAGVAITTAESEFGEMLFDGDRQAIYIFENDPEGESVCYDDCAEAWPPVLTKGDPVADGATKEGLLGTIERKDGTTQVTYAGKPLYYYAHEEPGEVRCHNIDLNGGLWWVVGPDGKRRP